MKSFPMRSQRVAFGAVVCLLVGPVLGQGAKPAASSPASRPAGVAAALKYAPDTAAGVIHVEPKALAKDVLAAFARNPAFKDLEANTIEMIAGMAAKIDSLDIFLEAAGEGGASNVVAVVRGPLAPADVNRAFASFAGGKENEILKADAKEKGRYKLGEGMFAIALVFGGESSDLPAGVTVMGFNIPSEYLADLGKGKNDDLGKLAAGVDAGAPIWAAVAMSKLDNSEDAPVSVTGSLYLLGGGKSRLEMVYKDANSALASMKDLQDSNRMDPSLATLMRTIGEPALDGATLRLVAKDANAALPRLVSALADIRRESKKSASMAYLREIGATIAVYAADHDDMLPADVLDLVKAQAIPAGMLASPAGGRTVKVDANGMPEGAFESDYIIVKYPMASLKIRNRAKMVLAYERPENYGKEGTIVLFVDEHVEWVKMDDFTKQLQATKDWIAAQEKEVKKDK